MSTSTVFARRILPHLMASILLATPALAAETTAHHAARTRNRCARSLAPTA